MLIKLYTEDNSLAIIDNITDISVPSFPAHGEYASENYKVYNFETPTELKTEQKRPFKIIEFAKNAPCILYVYGTAYICNDDGKTIEKVSVLG